MAHPHYGLDLLAEAIAVNGERLIEEVSREIDLLEASLTPRVTPVLAARQQRTASPAAQPPTQAPRPTPRPRVSQLPRTPSPEAMPRSTPAPRPTPRPRVAHVPRPVSPPPMATPSPCFISDPEESKYRPTSTPVALNPNAQEFSPPADYSSIQLARELKKPAIDIEKFSGDPTRYAQFCRQFNVRIVKNSDSYDECMSFLLQFTTGEAHDVVQGYAHLDAKLGFDAAIGEFQRRYGDPCYVSQAYVAKALEWPPIRADDPQALDKYGIFLRECQYAIQEMGGMGILEYSENLRRLVGKLPPRLHDRWRSVAFSVRDRGELITFGMLVEFVQREARKVMDPVYGRNALQNKPAGSTPAAKPVPKPRHKIGENPNTNSRTLMNTAIHSEHETTDSKSSGTSGNSDARKCPLCSEAHRLYKCKKFNDMTLKDKKNLVRTQRLCYNCLGTAHTSTDCQSKARCRVKECGANHHTLLHGDGKSQNPAPENAPSVHNTRCTTGEEKRCAPFFQLVPVYVYRNGVTLPTIAMLDSASQLTIIHQSLAKDLGLKGHKGELTINTMNSAAVMDSQVVSFGIKPQDPGNGTCMHINGAYALKVKNFQCTTQICSPSWDHCKGLGIPTEIKPEQVKLLIGLDNPEAHVQLEVRRGAPDEPLVVRTKLGWSLMGPGGDGNSTLDLETASVNLLSIEQPYKDLEEFWSTEAFGVASKCTKPTSMEDIRARKVLEENTTYQDGHYMVGMLWRNPDSELPNNIGVARRRFDLLMKRFNQDAEYARLYQETMNGYVAQGYARLMTEEEAAVSTPRTWYLPHHGVVNPNKPGKVRVVYDAASSFRGHSLNSALMSGPDLLNSLFGVLQRFRLHEVGLVTDIRAMYHQVKVPISDADSLRFLFKEDITRPGPPQTYQMVSHVFGATDSPACALYALRRTASDNAQEFMKDAVDTVLHDSYMDDVATSLKDVPSAVKVAQEVDRLLAKGGFETHQWLSNSRDVMEALHSLDLLTQEVRFDHDVHHIQRTLGVRWDIQDDMFTFVSQVKDNPLTKRGLVSTMSSVFDPCGFITPFTLRAKLLAQDLWKLQNEWDDELPPLVLDRWQAWLHELDRLPEFQLPRYHPQFVSSANNIELHIFTDASESAFAASAYLRYLTEGGYTSSFLASKSRVAPLKLLSIPRLELQGALLGARLGGVLESELNLPIKRKVYSGLTLR